MTRKKIWRIPPDDKLVGSFAGQAFKNLASRENWPNEATLTPANIEQFVQGELGNARIFARDECWCAPPSETNARKARATVRAGRRPSGAAFNTGEREPESSRHAAGSAGFENATQLDACHVILRCAMGVSRRGSQARAGDAIGDRCLRAMRAAANPHPLRREPS